MERVSGYKAVADMLGRLEQAADYYPYGELWRPPSGSSANAFLFEGKERLTADGIREWDYDARRYCSMHVPFFTTPDPLAEKTPWLSPYVFCAANPVMNIDPTGQQFITYGSEGDKYNLIYELNGTYSSERLYIKTSAPKDGKIEKSVVQKTEIFAFNVENFIRAENLLSLRAAYGVSDGFPQGPLPEDGKYFKANIRSYYSSFSNFINYAKIK